MRFRWILCVALFPAVCRLVAAKTEDGGGRDVSIALFSTRLLRSVTVTPVATDSWTAHCAQCTHKPLTGPLHVVGTKEIFAGGTLRVTDDASGAVRIATGLWHLRANGERGGVDVVLTIPSERYVTAVLNAEAARDEPSQSLQALAILARTYALNGRHFTAAAGHLTADLCDSTECQAMLMQPGSEAVDDAERSTAGETLWAGTHRAEVFFSQNCGGFTEDAGSVWPRLHGLSYLQSHADPYCVRRDTAAWHAEVPLSTFTEIAKAEGWHLPGDIVHAQVSQRSSSHRTLLIQVTGRNGNTAVVSASALRFGIGRALGWNQVRSDAYQLGVRNGALVFDGRGHGHGVGLCQAGASEMAHEGKSAREILGFYFSGTAVRILPADGGWLETRTSTLIVHSTQILSTARKTALEQTWIEARRRFPPRNGITPTIVLAPSTEMFRQLTTQPGWNLASTYGSTITLQPETILRAHGRDEAGTIRHEMLHVLVEAECSDRTPLWLREGLVEVLEGEGIDNSKAMPASSIEKALQHSDSLPISERAHQAAAALVKSLISRYGFSAVRGWLSSGVPAGVS